MLQEEETEQMSDRSKRRVVDTHIDNVRRVGMYGWSESVDALELVQLWKR